MTKLFSGLFGMLKKNFIVGLINSKQKVITGGSIVGTYIVVTMFDPKLYALCRPGTTSNDCQPQIKQQIQNQPTTYYIDSVRQFYIDENESTHKLIITDIYTNDICAAVDINNLIFWKVFNENSEYQRDILQKIANGVINLDAEMCDAAGDSNKINFLCSFVCGTEINSFCYYVKSHIVDLDPSMVFYLEGLTDTDNNVTNSTNQHNNNHVTHIHTTFGWGMLMGWLLFSGQNFSNNQLRDRVLKVQPKLKDIAGKGSNDMRKGHTLNNKNYMLPKLNSTTKTNSVEVSTYSNSKDKTNHKSSSSCSHCGSRKCRKHCGPKTCRRYGGCSCRK